MHTTRVRLYAVAIAALAGLIVTGSVTLASVSRSASDSLIAGPNDVINSSMAAGATDWNGLSDAGPVTLSRVTGVKGGFDGSTALQVTRTGDTGTWGEVLGSLNMPENYIQAGGTYRMSVWVRDLNASGRQFGVLLANANYLHRPSPYVYQGFTDTNWHLITKTFTATDHGYSDTKFYLGLPSHGQINMQMTGAEVVSLTRSSAPAAPGGTPTSTPTIAAPAATAPATTAPVSAPPVSVSATPLAPPVVLAPSRVISFGGTAGGPPSASEWNYEIGGNGWGNNELESYTNSTSNSYLDGNGHLVITARRETTTGPDGISRNYSSARLSTAGKVAVQPGSYVEASITAPVGAGVWPAFWTLGTNIGQVGWPQSGELDILEGTGATPTLAHSALHMASLSNPSADNQWGWGQLGGTNNLGVSLDAGPHVYGVYFDGNVVQFYIDHKLTMQYTAAQAASSNRSWPFGSPQYLILNIAIDSGVSSSTSFPRSMVVSPIGIYKGMPF